MLSAAELTCHVIRSELEAVDGLLHQRLQSPLPFVQEVVTYIFQRAGKRIRPQIVLLSAAALAYAGTRTCYFSSQY